MLKGRQIKILITVVVVKCSDRFAMLLWYLQYINTTNKNLTSINKCYYYEQKKTTHHLNSLDTVICITLPIHLYER